MTEGPHTGDAALRIRRAEAADTALILEFIRELAEYEKLPHEVTAEPTCLRDALFGDRPAAEVLIANVGAEPAGFALYFHNFSTFLGQPGIYLEDLFVRPAFRGHGVGASLLGELARIAVQRNCGRLEWSVLDWNAPAIGFYERLGAVPMEGWTVYRLTGDRLAAVANEDRGPAT